MSRKVSGGYSVARWVIVVGVGILVSQLFALGHLVLFAHELCEHGALVHSETNGWQSDTRQLTPPEGGVLIASSGGSDVEHDHCDPFATPPAVASVTATLARALLLETPVRLDLCAREAEPSVAILELAPKTSPTA